MKRSYLFDSHSLLTLFQQQDGHEKVVALLHRVRKDRLAKFISVINLGEIIYTVKRRFGNGYKLAAIAKIQQLNFDVLPASSELILAAAELKGERALSFADCIAAITAKNQGAAVVTGDPEFKEVEDLVEIHWIA